MPRSGIKGLDIIAWGTHLCLFYKSPAELRQLLTTYFQAGLSDGEYCVWITGPSLNEEEAYASLQQLMPEIPDFLRTGQLEIVPHTQWYVTDGFFRSEQVFGAWVSKLHRAIRLGFKGLRVAGDASWLSSAEQRRAFISYERQVTEGASAQPLLALCTYPTAGWVPEEMLQVMQCHNAVLLPAAGGWKALEVSHT